MQNLKNPLIFIIEDSLVYKDLIVGHLKSKKYKNITTFKNGDECMKALHQKPDLIILGYSYEGVNGLEIMMKIKGNHPEIDFIFLSAQNDVEVAIQIIKLGAADYIVKNEKAPAKLVKAIDQLASTSKQTKIKKGFKIGVVGFFIMLFVVIMVIMIITIFLEDFSF